MEQVTLRSYAKINLFLKVEGKRADGFHNIKTIFQTIDLSDKVEISKTPAGIYLNCDNPIVPADNSNIAWKAAELFLKEFDIRSGVKIKISKNIPVTAGLAGGSSNAAAVFNGCCDLFGVKNDLKKLSKLAISLGSDIPFLLKGGTAMGLGRGEVLTEMNPVKESWLVLVVEGVKPSTGKIYSGFTNTLTKADVFDKKLEELKKLKEAAGGDLAKILYNDLETPAGRFFPVIFKVKKDLMKNGALGALMSGSGPTVFGIAASKESAEEIAKKLILKYKRVIVAKTVKASSGR